MAKNETKIVEEVAAPEVKELTVAEVTYKYETLLNFLKPTLSHDGLVILAAKKKELFA